MWVVGPTARWGKSSGIVRREHLETMADDVNRKEARPPRSRVDYLPSFDDGSRWWKNQRSRLRNSAAATRPGVFRALHAIVAAAHVRSAVMQIGRIRRLSLPGRYLVASAERQYEEQRSEPSMQVHRFPPSHQYRLPRASNRLD